MNQVDAALFGELIDTLDAVFDLTARASVSRDPATVYGLRVKARSQLRVAEVLRRHLARSIRLQTAVDAKIDQPAGAGAGLPGRSRLQRPTSFPGGDQVAVNSDTPISDSGIPGLDAGSWFTTGAEGSTGGQHHPGGGGEFGPVRVSDPYNTVQAPADLPTAMQGYDSTTSVIDPMKDVVSGTVTPPAVVPGAHVAGPRHPNAGR